jgi:hypothetical protein
MVLIREGKNLIRLCIFIPLKLPDNLVQEFKNIKLHVENQFLPISQFLFDSNTDTHQNLENMIMAWCKYILETLQTQMPNYDQVESNVFVYLKIV